MKETNNMNMNAIAKTMVVLSALCLAACGEPVEVPPSYLGKIVSANGVTEGVIQPSQFRLDM